MTKYFFLGSLFPPLKITSKLTLFFQDILEIVSLNMTHCDLKKLSSIRQYIDIKNVYHFLKKQPLDSRGHYNKEEIEEALLNREGFPHYLFVYFDEYETITEQQRYFSKVLIQFFREMEKNRNGFLKFYFNFEREWRLILAGKRAKELGIDLAQELQHEDLADPFVAQIISQRDSSSFAFPYGYEDLGERLQRAWGNPKEEYEAMAAFRFEKITEKIQDSPFSIDYILGYCIQLMILEDWSSLNEAEGKQRTTKIIGNI